MLRNAVAAALTRVTSPKSLKAKALVDDDSAELNNGMAVIAVIHGCIEAV
jgi:hypothetical protein